MGLLDCFVNIVQSLVIGIVCMKYVQKDKIMFSLILALLMFACVSFFNLHSAYEGFFALTYSAIIFIFVSIVGQYGWIENLFLSLLINLLISVGNDTIELFLHLITGMSILEMAGYTLLRNSIGIGAIFILSIIMHFAIYVRKKFDNIFTRYTNVILVVCLISNYVVIVLENFLFNPLYEQYTTEILLSVIFILLISSLSIYVLFSEKISSIHQKNVSMLYQQLDLIQDQLVEFEKNNDKISILRHDMKNNLLVLNEFISKNDLNGAKKLIAKLSSDVNDISVSPTTGILPVDCILASKSEKAKLNGIAFISQINKKCIEVYDGMDIALILANALDNAIENISSKDPEINLLADEKNGYTRIIVRNTVNEDVLRKNPNLQSTKNNKEMHGYGIESMKLLAEKYNGHLSFFQENREFSLLIILPIIHSSNE